MVQVGVGQPWPREVTRDATLIVATAVPHDPHMALHALDDRPEEAGHLLVPQRGGPAWLQEQIAALWSWVSTIARAEVRLHDHPAVQPDSRLVLGVDLPTPAHAEVRWHSSALNAQWFSRIGYYRINDASGHRSSDVSRSGPCGHNMGVALAAGLARTWALAIPGTLLFEEGSAPSLPLQYSTHRLWVHTVDTEVILSLLRHADHKGAMGVPAGAAKAVSQLFLKWLKDSLSVPEEYTQHLVGFVCATSHHSNVLLHKADWAASQDAVRQNVPPGPSHAQLIVPGDDGHLEMRPPTMQERGAVAQAAQHNHASTHRCIRPWAQPTPRPTSTAGTSTRQPPTTGSCEPGIATHRCNVGFAPRRSGSPPCPSLSNHAFSAEELRRP